MCTGTGCGAFVTDTGIFPMPTIHIVYPVPLQVGLPFETVLIDSPSGPMFAWFIPAQNARGTVFINHGSVFNRGGYIEHYQLLNDLGYHVFAYDYQGFGENFNVVTIGNILGDANTAGQAP
ncbi:MAG: alpha/beta hydrolase [Planctomycetes bacterium]|nr:alpha/beta hydrolase [Planctomycetota bacterium]